MDPNSRCEMLEQGCNKRYNEHKNKHDAPKKELSKHNSERTRGTKTCKVLGRCSVQECSTLLG